MQRLLEATLLCAQDVGLAEASTSMICARAGVSRGALTHHFPSRAELVRAAVQYATDNALAAMDRELASAAGAEDPLGALFDALWNTTEGPLFTVALELLVATRHDPVLWPDMEERRRVLAESVDARLQAVLVPMAAGTPARDRLQQLLEATVFLVRGIALQRYAGDDPRRLREAFDAWCATVRAAFGAGDDRAG